MIVPKEALAAETRAFLDMHTEWDALHAFVTLHWTEAEQRVVPGTYAAIDPALHPMQYLSMMLKMAEERRRDDAGKDFPPACAYLIQIESFGVMFDETKATEEEKAQFHKDRLNRTFHQRSDAVESCDVWTADVHGRLWAAAQIRGEEKVTEKFYPPGRPHPGGQLIEALMVVASIGAVKSFGLPVIPGTASIARTLAVRRAAATIHVAHPGGSDDS